MRTGEAKGAVAAAAAFALVGAAVALMLGYAPTEVTMRQAQRVLYLHVAVTWCGLAACLGMGVCAAAYLRGRRLRWDAWGQAAAEVGLVCLTVTLATGSLWAHQAWGVWWTWEPRLTSSFVLWLILAGMFVARSGTEDPHRRARVGAVLALLAVADLPLVILATRLFRGVHPVSPRMDPRMRWVLWAGVGAFTVFFAVLTWVRQQQLRLAGRVAMLEARADETDGR